jgi:hypothetical protein
MIGIHRRRRIEGWAVEVSESQSTAGPYTLRQKLADNNKLWLIILGAILAIALWLLFNTIQTEIVPSDGPAGGASIGSYDDSRHQDFTNWFLGKKPYADSVLEGGFVGPNMFRLIMPSDASADDIDYTSKMTASLIEHKLRERTVVQVYLKRASTGSQQLVATTQYEPDSHGYKTKFHHKTSGP